ncbi:hypothetical protein GCM10010505_42520 [Kitasatospora aburaviensis]
MAAAARSGAGRPVWEVLTALIAVLVAEEPGVRGLADALALEVAQRLLMALLEWLWGGVAARAVLVARPSHRVWGAPFPPSSSGSARGGELCGVLCHLYAMLSCTVGEELNPCVALHAPRAG